MSVLYLIAAVFVYLLIGLLLGLACVRAAGAEGKKNDEVLLTVFWRLLAGWPYLVMLVIVEPLLIRLLRWVATKPAKKPEKDVAK